LIKTINDSFLLWKKKHFWSNYDISGIFNRKIVTLTLKVK